MFDDKQLHILAKALDCAIENGETYLKQYDGYLSIEEQKAYREQIENYEYVKIDIECEIGNRAIAEQMG